MMILLPHDVFSRNVRLHDRRGRLRRRCRVCLGLLEDRTLLSGTPVDVLAGIAIPIVLGTPTTGTLAAGDTIFYQVNPTAEGKLVAQVDSGGVAMRLSLLNGQDQVLTQSDGQSPANPNAQIAVDVAVGPEYLEVEDLGVAGAYTVTTSLLPGSTPFQPIPLSEMVAPSALVAGDFNGDGRTDLAVVNAGQEDIFGETVIPDSVSVLLGNGDGTFQNQVTSLGVSGSTALLAGDFNGDGRTDLAVACFTLATFDPFFGDFIPGTSAVSVLLGNGDGTFQPQVTYAVGYDPVAIVAGDFTGDGRTDLAVVNAGQDFFGETVIPGSVSVLLGNGDGTFQPQVTCAAGNSPDAIVAGDFNGDGRTDLAVVNNADNDVSVLLGNGDGTFQPQVTYAVGNSPYAIVAGDFTGDGRTDLAVVNNFDNDVSVLLGNGDGTFQTQKTYAVEPLPSAIVAGDFNGDGRTDLAVLNSNSDANSPGSVSVLLGNGDGTFQAQVTCVVGTNPTALVAGDFNGDGRTDLAVLNYPDKDVSVLLGNGDGAFQTQATNALETNPAELVAGDFNGDGRTDLADSGVSVLLGNGDGTFQPQVTYAAAGGDGIVAGDFNGDGRTDLATANAGDNDVSVLLGNGDGTFQPQVTYAVGSFPTALVAGDFNSDGRTDLAVTNLEDNTVSVLLGNGDGTFQPQAIYAVGNGPSPLLAGDFTGDGRTDLAVANLEDNTVSVLLGNGDGTFQPQVTYAVGSQPDALVAGDFTGDGRSDLAVAAYDGYTQQGELEVLLINGDGTFQAETPINLGGVDPLSLVAGDFTGDGRTDLAFSSDSGVSVLLGNGDGTFQNPVTYAVGNGTSALLAGDFNGDGRTDLATATLGSDNLLVLLNNGDGTFSSSGPSVTTLQAAPLMADLTGDGVNDVLVVDGAGDILWRRGQAAEPGTFDPPLTINPGHPSRDIVAVDTNQGMVLASVDARDHAVSLYAWRNGSFALIASLPTGSLPAQIVTADLTGDGLDDLVVRNAGDGTLSVYLNTASENGPFITLPPPFLPPLTLNVGPGISDVTLADVSGDGRTDILVTDQLTGEVGVVRNLAPGYFAPPVLYAAGTGLYAVTSAGGPAALTTFEATAGVAAAALTAGGPADLVAINPGSNSFSVLSGLGGGRFANPVTLLTATPAIAVLVADLEGNGIPDTIVLSASSVTVYRGDGQGGFLPDPFTIAAGLDPTGMTLADLSGDGKLDLLVTNAYGDLLILLGNGDGTFQPHRSADQKVALAVLPNGSPTPDFIYADQGLNRVVVDYASGPSNVVGDRSSGLLAPGAVALADLNGGGIQDLIVANSGSNNVLVYPGLGNGQFGPALNGGYGFFTGTNPVGITVANLNGRPDLIIADKGSNDVSILLNVATADGGFTFVPGPRLKVGDGPVATVVTYVNSIPADLMVSNSVSNDVWILPSVGGGNFNDQNPRKLPVGTTPGPIFVGNFTPGQGPQILTVNAGSNDVTVISDFTAAAPVFGHFSTGGLDPSAAFEVTLGGNGLEGLVIANTGNGTISLLGGNGGTLGLEGTLSASQTGLPEPSSLELASVSSGDVEFYATTSGVEGASLLAFILGGAAPAIAPSASASTAAAATLLPLSVSETALALVSTLLMVSIDSQSVLAAPSEQASESEGGGAAVISFLPEATSFAAASSAVTQGLLNGNNDEEGSGGGDEVEDQVGNPVPQETSNWTGFFLGIDGLIDRVFDEIQGMDRDAGKRNAADESARESAFDPLSLGSRPATDRPPGNPDQCVAERARQVDRISTLTIDKAIRFLGTVQPAYSQPIDSLSPGTPGPASDVAQRPSDPPATQSGATVAAWVPLVIASMMVIRVNLPDKRVAAPAGHSPGVHE